MIKTTGTILAATQVIEGYSVFKSSTINVSAEAIGTVFVQYAPINNYILSKGIEFRIDGSSGNNKWFTLQRFTTNTSPPNTLVQITSVVNPSRVSTFNNFGLELGEPIFIKHPTTSLCEWNRVAGFPDGNSITFLDPLVNSHTNTSVIHDNPEEFTVHLDLISFTEIRLVADASATDGRNIFSARLNLGRI